MKLFYYILFTYPHNNSVISNIYKKNLYNDEKNKEQQFFLDKRCVSHGKSKWLKQNTFIETLCTCLPKTNMVKSSIFSLYFVFFK